MSSIIFYGAGGNAENNFEKWIDQGIFPVCFCDSDESKHHVKFITKKGEYDILPLKKAIERYPDYIIYPTQHQSKIKNIISYLINNGIAESKIKIFSRHCNYLNKYMYFQSIILNNSEYNFCCFNKNTYKSSGDIETDFNTLQKKAVQMIDDLDNGKICSCSYCNNLKEGKMPDFPPRFEFNLSTGINGGTNCNLKCSYCFFSKILNNSNTFGYNILDILYFIQNKFNKKNIFLDYNCGEITVSPHYNKIMDIWKKNNWKGRISTNAVIYSEGIAELMRLGLIKINVSLDAGTAETYSKIKGKNYFNKTLETLKYYSDILGNIELKYLFVKDSNDNENDIINFLKIAKKLNVCVVIISRNSTESLIPLSEHEKYLLKYFIYTAKNYGLKVINYFNLYIKNIKDIDYINSLI
ncbi:MAG: radical SAM protein [Treponema sp.]|nr:radical SAM protein [Treponema sp.]